MTLTFQITHSSRIRMHRLSDYKEKWGRLWTEKLMRLGARSSQRVEAAAGDLESFIIDTSTIDARWHLRTAKHHASYTPIVGDNILYANVPEATRVQERFNKLKHDIATAYKDCQTSSQRIELLMALTQILSGFVAVDINDIYLPTDVKAKGRPKLTKVLRLPSLWEHAEAKQ
ncbi:hypothetical protein BJV82DRAFT_583269 [Fennellomyces sp. T-0311]|nr:hypothetical protein BJV82DRAFT_583269 [Fennellomyces sp. T-0311]